MPITTTLFNKGIGQLDELCQNIRGQQENSQQRIRFAIFTLQILTSTFHAAKCDPNSIAKLTFKDVATCYERLANLNTLILKPESPFSSPSKLRVNHEMAANEAQVKEQIVKAQQAVLRTCFAKLNGHLAYMLQDLSQFARLKSQENRQIFEDYTSRTVETEDLLRASNAIAANLEALQKFVAKTSGTASLMLKMMTLENLDMSLACEEDLKMFEKLIHEIYSEYDKISDSLTFFHKQNDSVARILYYRSKIKEKKDLTTIEEDSEGKCRDTLPVLKDYKRMIKGCLADLEMVLNETPPSLVRVLRAYAELANYNEAKNNFVEDEMEICDEEAKKLKEKVKREQAHFSELNKSGAVTKKKLEEARRKMISREERCLDYAEYVREIEKAAEKTVYFDTDSILDNVKAMPEYYPYLTQPTFDFLLKVPTDHWLLGSLELAAITELEQAAAGFKRYDDAIRSFRQLMRGLGRTEPAIKPFIFLESAILGTDRAK